MTFGVELKCGLAKTGPIFGVEDIVCDEFDFLFVVEGKVGVMIDLQVFKLDFTFGCELLAPKKLEKNVEFTPKLCTRIFLGNSRIP